MEFWKKRKSTAKPTNTAAKSSIPLPPTIMGNHAVARSLHFLQQTIQHRLDQFFGKVTTFKQPDFEFANDGSFFGQFVIQSKLKVEEFLVLLLALAPHAHPDFFSTLINKHLPKGGAFPAFGGVKGEQYRGILPTGETILFLLAGRNIDRRLEVWKWLREGELTIFREGVVYLESPTNQEPEMSGRLMMTEEKITEFLTESKWKPKFGGTFPASLLETELKWKDLILSPSVHRELQMIKDWLTHETTLRKDPHLGVRLKPGFRALFHGPPGTGKTLTATLLGKACNKDVFRVDLSMVVSKYIGETEKNLQGVFDTAANKDWILFFDEADALFGKRTNVQSAHDRFANQEVSYLLQRVEEHAGLVILASNFKNNLDQAFMRRFQTIIQFSMPGVAERRILWNNTLPTTISKADDISLDQLAERFELSGAAILNIVHAASIRALSEKRPIQSVDLMEGIRHEFAKSGRTL